jgi:cytochrome c peroxidase
MRLPVFGLAAVCVVGGSCAVSRSALLPSPRGTDEVYLSSGAEVPNASTVALGRRLFFDPIVSRDSSIACASCHRPSFAFGDSVPFSSGVAGRHALRNTPPLVNRTYSQTYFWDGRGTSLERTVLMPIDNPNELALTVSGLLERLRRSASYQRAFQATFPTRGVSSETLAAALAAYVRSLRFGDSPVDRYLEGDSTALTPAAQRGYELFIGAAGCSSCHFGPTFSDQEFHNTGVSYGGADSGRIAVTRTEDDRGRFRTPTLRDVAHTAPYMHDGSMSTLEEVVEFYNRGGNPNPHLDPAIRERRLATSELSDLIAFLSALSSRSLNAPK